MGKKALALVIVLLSLAGTARAETVVIVNRDNPLASISRTELGLIYFGKKKLFENGDTIVPADLPADNAARADFFENVLGKSDEAFRRYWVRMIFSGKGPPPVAFGNEREAVKFVASSRGGIAFIDSSNLGPGVKTIPVYGGE